MCAIGNGDADVGAGEEGEEDEPAFAWVAPTGIRCNLLK